MSWRDKNEWVEMSSTHFGNEWVGMSSTHFGNEFVENFLKMSGWNQLILDASLNSEKIYLVS